MRSSRACISPTCTRISAPPMIATASASQVFASIPLDFLGTIVHTSNMKNAIALLFVLIFGGCAGPTPPNSYSIDDAFSPAEREVIHSAVEAWCEETGDCPVFTPLHSEAAHFALVDDLPEGEHARRVCPEGRTCTTNGRERDGLIRIARNRVPGLDILWLIAAHEYGHLCIDDHPPGSALMSAVHDEPLLEVDSGAVRLWKDGCH